MRFLFILLAGMLATTGLSGQDRLEDYQLHGNVSECNVKTIEFTAFGEKIENPKESLTSYHFNEEGYQVLEVDKNGSMTVFEYDTKNRLIFRRWDSGSFSSAITRFEYNSDGTTKEIKEFPNGDIRSMRLTDSAGFLLEAESRDNTRKPIMKYFQTSDPDGLVSEYQRYSSGKVSRTITTRYNKDGQLVFERSVDNRSDRIEYFWEYKYEQGLPVYIVYTESDRYTGAINNTEWHYSYNNKKKLLKLVIIINGVQVETRSYIYANGLLSTEKVEYLYISQEELQVNENPNPADTDNIPQIFAELNLAYDSEGRLRSAKTVNNGEEFSANETREYNGEILSGRAVYNSSGFLLERFKTAYNRQDLAIRRDNFGTDSWTTYWEYNKEGKLVSQSRISETRVYLSGKDLSYDQYGNLILEQNYGEGKQKTIAIRTEYEYDSYNNWIKKQSWRNDNINEIYDLPESVVERDIIYFE